MIHVWNICHHCGMSPIVGACFRCETCPLGPEIDLCSRCYHGYQEGRVPHPTEAVSMDLAKQPHVFVRSEGVPREACEPWLHIRCPETAPPSVLRGFLVRPEFRYGRQSSFGGYGFIARHGEHVILLTALHVMDEIMKRLGVDTTARNTRYTGEELPSLVESVQLYDVLQDRWMLHELGVAAPMLALPNARTADEEPYAWRDIAAFRVPAQTSLNAAPLAAEEPQVGDPVWLAGHMPDRTRTRRAVCVDRTPNSFVFRYEEAKAMPPHSSGAPILDRVGHVVGINTGLGKFAGHDMGHANPLSSIRAHLAEALFVYPKPRGPAMRGKASSTAIPSASSSASFPASPSSSRPTGSP